MATDCFSQLDQFHSKVTASQLESLHDKFDIPRRCRLIAPANSEAIYHHGGGRSPLYIRHLECGLRLPLHPFLRGVFEALGVSPMQMKPNSIAILVGYVVICHWLEIDPSLNVLGHLVSVRFSKEAHYYLQGAGKFKIVANLPESNKDWKERFVWMEGDDSGLECPDWPAIRKGVLVKKSLSLVEQRDLDRILSYSGSRVMEDLLDDSVLRVAGISALAPKDRDVFRAERRAPKGRPAERVRKDTPSRPEKRRHEGSPARASEPTPAPSRPEERPSEPTPAPPEAPSRLKRKKTTVGPYGAWRAAEAATEATVDPPGQSGEPVSRMETQAGSSSPDDCPREEEGPSREPESTRKEGKEPEAGVGPARSEGDWTSRYSTLDVGTERWNEMKALLLGKTPAGPLYDTEPDADHKHDPALHLDVRTSVLASRPAQARAVQQFLLPSDDQFLREVPAVGLHMILRSYLVRGALVENEVYRRLVEARAAHARFKGEVAAYERESAEAEEAVKELSLKQAEVDELRREAQVKGELLKKQRAKNSELRRRLEESQGSSRLSEEALREKDLAAVRQSMAV